MEKRIDLERRGRKPGTITELNLDNCRSTSIVGLTDEYSALQSLSLINVGLTTLKGFPKLPNLKKLELSDNRISNGLNLLHTSPKLQYLNLSGNKIKDLDTLKPLKEFQHLAVLDLFNNEATQTENYREKIFELLPSLKFLDGFDCNDVEAPSEGDDEEENGNYSEDEDRIRKEQEQVKQKRKPKEEEAEEEEQVENEEEQYRAFCLNGIEIDLDELEAFENCLKMKRHQMIMTKDPNSVEVASAMIAHSCEQRDDLDEYFEKLQLNQTEIMDNKRQKVEKDYKKNNNNNNNNTQVDTTSTTNAITTTTTTITTTKFVLLLYWFLAILNLASAVCHSESDNSGDDEDAGSDDFSEDEDNGDVSLAEVYNDDLEEDEDDWDEGNAEGEDDDDVDTDIDDLNDSVATASAQDKEKVQASNNVNNDAAEEPETRGKKRKLDG